MFWLIMIIKTTTIIIITMIITVIRAGEITRQPSHPDPPCSAAADDTIQRCSQQRDAVEFLA